MDLIDKIYNLINEVMCAEYTAGMTLEINGAEVDKCNLCPQNTEDEYVLLLDLNQWRAPLSLAYQGTEEGFLNFLRKEFRSRQLDKTQYYTGIQTTPGDGTEFIIFDYGSRKGSS